MNAAASSFSPRLWYDRPAEDDWNSALPLGSGRLGAMVYGNLAAERLQLNEDTVWNGGPRDRQNPDTQRMLPEIRRLLNEGRLAAAHALVNDAMAGLPDSMRCYEPLADLFLTFDHPGLLEQGASEREELANAGRFVGTRFTEDQIGAYRRELDLATAVAAVDYTLAGHTYRRRHLASAADGAIVTRLEAETSGTLNVSLRLERGPRSSYSTRPSDTSAKLDGGRGVVLFGRTGVDFACALAASHEGGSFDIIGETVVIRGADAVTVTVAAATSFRESDPAAAASRQALAALELGWERLLERHLAEYRPYFDRVELAMGDPDTETLPTDRRLARLREGAADPALAALYFHFGRYLLIASSRPGSLPANLQGIWNHEFWPAWGSKYTININTEMNYWPAEPANLADCHQPLFDMLARVAENGRKTAEVMYGCRGFVCHHNTDLWADTCPTDRNLAASYWTLGGAWLALHLWDHYAYNPDDAFLQETAYPILREASRFFLDFLIEDAKGRLIISPSASPENVYRLPNGECGVLGNGCRMDAHILTMLFRHTRDAAARLDRDEPLREELNAALARLPGPEVGPHGRLLEWLEDYEDTDPQHRHVSHGFALHPGDLISPRTTPELAAAMGKTLTLRGDEGTGWCMAWKALFWARLGRGDKAHDLFLNLLRPVEGGSEISMLDGGTYPNLFCAHPPFQIDGNFGGTAAVLEMLLQSHEREPDPATGVELPVLHLLPALPEGWSQGSFRGLRARGGFTVEAAWRDGKLTGARLASAQGGTCFVLTGGKLTRVELAAGGSFDLPV